ncbi:sulfite oxidase isoform X5 [Cucumis melo]|uniref:Sulfite oxidase isoform X5 n=1 Tax=Cucumis melo TaxID=3656 RepID=A0ABM3KL76_CUCME|nr:sulfite oxidase isoform X5 [Cucumis melo]
MPGLTAPSDYSQEPLRHPSLIINAKEPFNAEPPRSALISSYITPVHFFYKRNHGPIPLVDDIERMLPKYNVTATLQEEKGGPYKASIPLIQASNPEADVLLAYEMNGEPLNRDHGYPLRVIVPGVIGARSVKWLDSISINAEECQGFFMQKDYKMFPPSVDWSNIDWSARRPQMDFPIQCAICSLEDVDHIKPGKVTVSGYAVAGGGRGIERVDISVDGGKNWIEATRYQKIGVPYVADSLSSYKWAWVFFEITVDILRNTEIVAKAVDSAANVQPEKVEEIWNVRGILNNSWHRVQVGVGRSSI